MIIANPIYDVVFKHLMDDFEIAKGVLSSIINEDVVGLDFSSKERPIKVHDSITLWRLDFIAKIKLVDGTYKNILIEIQKAKFPEDVFRFRNYLGRQYLKRDEIVDEEGNTVEVSLPIITIYFLGFLLSKELPSVVKVNRGYYNTLSGEKINMRDDFIESLTHDSHIIQIKKLEIGNRTRLERILSVFKQEHFIDEDKHLIDYEHMVEDPLVQKILRELHKIQADQEVQERMQMEDEIYNEIKSSIDKANKRTEEANKRTKEAKKQTEEAKKQTEDVKQQLSEERENAIKVLMDTGCMSREKACKVLGISD